YDALFVVHAGQAQYGIGHRAVLGADHFFGLELGLRVHVKRPEGLILIQILARPTRLVHQHRARVDEAFDLEVAQAAHEPACAFDVDRLVERVVFSTGIEVGDQVNDRCNVAAMTLAYGCQRIGDSTVRGKIGGHHGKTQAFDRLAVHADNLKLLLQCGHDRPAEVAGGAGDDDDRFGRAHASALRRTQGRASTWSTWSDVGSDL